VSSAGSTLVVMKHSVTTPKFVLPALGLALLCPVVAHSAAIEYTGPAYTQNFDLLASTGSPSWTAGETLAGWHWINESGTVPSTYAAAVGNSGQQNQILSYGNSGDSDRALGGQNGNGVATLYYGAQILNSTGNTLDAFSLAYTGEQWRAISNESNDGLTFEYQIFNVGSGSLSAASGWNAVSDLNFTAPRTVSSSTNLDGNDSANRTSISSTVSGITWADGQEIWLRWADNNPVDNSSSSLRAGMAIDDLTFSATASIPEPSGFAVVFGTLSLGFASLRRRRTGPAKTIDR